MTGHHAWHEIKHKAGVAEPPSAIEFSCLPWTRLELDGHGAAMDRILTALEADPRAIGPVVSFDDETLRFDALFQVEGAGGFSDAVETAAAIFDNALREADLERYTIGVSIVLGGPEGLP